MRDRRGCILCFGGNVTSKIYYLKCTSGEFEMHFSKGIFKGILRKTFPSLVITIVQFQNVLHRRMKEQIWFQFWQLIASVVGTLCHRFLIELFFRKKWVKEMDFSLKKGTKVLELHDIRPTTYKPIFSIFLDHRNWPILLVISNSCKAHVLILPSSMRYISF